MRNRSSLHATTFAPGAGDLLLWKAMIVQKRYGIGHRRTTWGSVVYQVIDGHSSQEVLDFLTESEAARRANTLNQAYEIFIEATATWRHPVAA